VIRRVQDTLGVTRKVLILVGAEAPQEGSNPDRAHCQRDRDEK
jgi:hypothetical protein